MNALYIVCGLGFLSLIAEIVNLKKGLTVIIVIGLIAAAWLTLNEWGQSNDYYHNMISTNDVSSAFIILILLISAFWFWMSSDYFRGQTHQTDRSALVLFALTGALLMVTFSNMAMLFLGIEVLSLSLYVLAGSRKESLLSNEAAFKYFLMGSFATGFLLMGIALIYGATGSFSLSVISEKLTTDVPAFFHAGIVLMLVAMLFKISAVPFHFWAPDTYEGAPTTITAFMSTVVKIAAFAAFNQLFFGTYHFGYSSWILILQVVIVLTLVVPPITALYQKSVKRMLAYSSVGHVGYILLGFVSSTNMNQVFYYLTSYAITSMVAFTVLNEVEKSGNISFNGLYKKSPALAVAMTIALLSLAGIPPLAGFFAKYLVFVTALGSGYTGMVFIAVGASLIGVYFYFQVIISMFLKDADGPAVSLSGSTKILLLILITLTILLGVLPNYFSTLFPA